MKKNKNEKIVATPAQLSATFTEWLRRWHESPEATLAAAKAVLTTDPRTYGDECTPYFISLLNELKKAQS